MGPDYLLQARQMQALSLGVHIPLVCFGIAFPVMVLFVESLYRRTGEPTYKTLATRWSKVMLLFFAIGVVTGTILSFELGLLWPHFMERWGEVFGVAFAIEGFAFFVEAIFIAIYVYGHPNSWRTTATAPDTAGRAGGRAGARKHGRGRRVTSVAALPEPTEASGQGRSYALDMEERTVR